MNNMELWEKSRSVPPSALKEIKAGRLKGKSDINPMWRIKVLTEQFGPCGVGWKYTITKQWLERGHGEEIAAFCNIDLQIKYNGEWSEAIPGTGGSAFVAQESKGPYTSDECYKMALTDAISVACKALGVGADVYWNADATKRDDGDLPDLITKENAQAIRDLLSMSSNYTEAMFCAQAKIAKVEDLPAARFKGAFNHVQSVIKAELDKAA